MKQYSVSLDLLCDFHKSDALEEYLYHIHNFLEPEISTPRPLSGDKASVPLSIVITIERRDEDIDDYDWDEDAEGNLHQLAEEAVTEHLETRPDLQPIEIRVLGIAPLADPEEDA